MDAFRSTMDTHTNILYNVAVFILIDPNFSDFNPGPAEPGYALPLQTV